MSKEITEHHNWATALSHCPSFHDVWCIAQWVEMNPASTAGRKFAQLVSSDNLPMGFKGMLQPKMKIQPSFTHTRRDQKRVDFESGLRPEESETIISCPLSCYRQHVDSVLTRSDSLLVLTWLDSNELNSTTNTDTTSCCSIQCPYSESQRGLVMCNVGPHWLESWSL